MRAHVLAVAIAALLAAWANPALAEPRARRVIVVNLSGELPGDLAAAPEQMSGDLAEVIRESGSEVTRAGLEDVLALAGCGEASDQCLQQALAILEVGSLVTGEVEPAGPDQVSVRLRLVAARRPARSRSFQLAAGPGLAAGFRTRAAAFWRDPDAEPQPEPEPEPFAPAPIAPASEPSPEARFSASRVRGYSWAVAGSGVGLTLVGGILLAAAADKQSQVDAAPTNTPDDFDALVDLEESGKRYARWGTAFLVVGAVATTAGVALIVKQGMEREPATAGRRRRAPAITLAPSLVGGGLGAVLTVQEGP